MAWLILWGGQIWPQLNVPACEGTWLLAPRLGKGRRRKHCCLSIAQLASRPFMDSLETGKEYGSSAQANASISQRLLTKKLERLFCLPRRQETKFMHYPERRGVGWWCRCMVHWDNATFSPFRRPVVTAPWLRAGTRMHTKPPTSSSAQKWIMTALRGTAGLHLRKLRY